MPFATGPWHPASELPDDPRQLCLVVLEHARFGRTHHAMRYSRRRWRFEDGLELSPERRVVQWAYITDSIEHIGQADPLPEGELPPESRLFHRFHLTDAERVRLLLEYVRMLRRDVELLQEQVDLSGNAHELVRLRRELKGLRNLYDQRVPALERHIERLKAAVEQAHAANRERRLKRRGAA